MPIIVKDFTWQQTEELITIRVPLKGVSSYSVDIFTTDNYIKANFPPYFFEAFLNSNVNENNSKCTISENEIVFELQKSLPKSWDSLTADISKLEMLEKRKAIIEKHHSKTEEIRKNKKEKLSNLQRFSVQQQIDRDSKNRKIIDEKRDAEKLKVMSELDKWVENNKEKDDLVVKENTTVLNKTIFQENYNEINNIEAKPELTTELKHEPEPEPQPEPEPEPEPEPQGDNNSKSNPQEVVAETVDVFPMPLPRNPGTITINFTHRDFPTPSRESQAPQEEEWLKKQVEARRATGFVAEDLRPEECNPTWLKDKGDSFYKVGNYLGAVSAYSHAIKLGSKMAGLYANRGAAHLGLGNLHKALDDCSQALELMTPHVPANLEARAKCHARRGAILCRLGLPDAGVADFECALKLLPNDLKLQQDLEHAKCLAKNLPVEEDKFDGIQIISN